MSGVQNRSRCSRHASPNICAHSAPGSTDTRGRSRSSQPFFRLGGPRPCAASPPPSPPAAAAPTGTPATARPSTAGSPTPPPAAPPSPAPRSRRPPAPRAPPLLRVVPPGLLLQRALHREDRVQHLPLDPRDLPVLPVQERERHHPVRQPLQVHPDRLRRPWPARRVAPRRRRPPGAIPRPAAAPEPAASRDPTARIDPARPRPPANSLKSSSYPSSYPSS